MVSVERLLHVEGMMCQNCARHVREALENIPGVSNVNVDLSAKTVSVTADGSVEDSAFRSAVEEAGYDFNGIDTL